jgi:cell division protein FtsI (penicillin-binding protein 3)
VFFIKNRKNFIFLHKNLIKVVQTCYTSPIAAYSKKAPHKLYSDIAHVLNHLGIAYQLNSGNNWIQADTLKGKVMLDKREITKNTIPNVLGMTARDAVFILEDAGLKVKMKGYGKVSTQSKSVGVPFEKGELVTLELNP